MKNTLFAILVVALFGCEGPVGPAGLNSLVDMSNEPAGLKCQFGGTKITSGIDANQNGVLDEDEIKSTQYACNGANGGGSRVIQINSCCAFSTGENPTVPIITSGFLNFNADLYPGYDSIVAVVRCDVLPVALGPSVTNVNAFFELVDVTSGNVPIADSQMTITTGKTWISDNLYGKFPSGFADIGFRTSTADAKYQAYGSAFFLLFDRN